MNLQVIHSITGKPEFVLLPISIFEKLSVKLQAELASQDSEYVPFVLEDYIDNPVALARMQAHLKQEELATLMHVSQAYISQLEAQAVVTPKTLDKIQAILMKVQKKSE